MCRGCGVEKIARREQLCEACRTERARERCAWGDGCQEHAGYGIWAHFCRHHAERLAAVRDRPAPPRANIRTAPPPSTPPPDPEPRHFHVPIEERVTTLVEALRERGPLPATEAAQVLGLAPPQ